MLFIYSLRSTPIMIRVMTCLLSSISPRYTSYCTGTILYIGFSLSSNLLSERSFSRQILVGSQCGGSRSWNIYIAREKVWEGGGEIEGWCLLEVEGLFGSTFKEWIKAPRNHAVHFVSDGKINLGGGKKQQPLFKINF